MRSLKHKSLWIGVIYFMILLGIALWVRDIPNQFDPLITIQQVVEESKYNDPKYFATAAIDISENGWISGANEWVFNLWPPGFVLLETLIIKVLGPDAPLVLVLQILAAMLFSIILVLLYDLLNTYLKREIVAFVLPLLIFAFPVSRVFLLQPIGITLGESFAVGFFLVSLLLAFRSVERKSIIYAAYAGLCLALSAYFRSQFELILLALTAWGILFVIAILLTRLRNFGESSLDRNVVKAMVVMLLVAHAATAPWRAYHWIYHGSLSWVKTSDLVFVNSVATSEYLKNDSGGFVVAGGGNLVCRIDPATCGDTENAKKLFIETFFAHPVEWYSLKLSVIGKYWFSSAQNWVNVSVESTSVDIAINGLLLVFLAALLGLLFTRKVRSQSLWILLMWISASLFSTYLLIFTIVHYEVRYFYFPKIAGIFITLIVLGMYFRQKNKIEAWNQEVAR